MPDPKAGAPVKQNRADYVFCSPCGVMVPRKYLRDADALFGDGKECPEGHPIPADELAPPAPGAA